MKPTYNHTRGDSPMNPCPICRQDALSVEGATDHTEALLEDCQRTMKEFLITYRPHLPDSWFKFLMRGSHLELDRIGMIRLPGEIKNG